jgi:RNA polymerase sigma-70 factor (ECF subfamily)
LVLFCSRVVETMSETHSAADFPTTQWSLVVRAADPKARDARAALAELCTAYWYPLYVMIRRKGYLEVEANDLTQEYFAQLLEGRAIRAADPRKGKFRTFLRTDCGFFLADQRDHERALKRGGGRSFISIDVGTAETSYQIEPSDNMTPERLFDHAWALTLLRQVLARIETEYSTSGRRELFVQLQAVLTEGPRSVPYSILAARMDMTEAAIQKAVARLRTRYGQLLREQIAATLDDPSPRAVEDEIRDLFNALAR